MTANTSLLDFSTSSMPNEQSAARYKAYLESLVDQVGGVVDVLLTDINPDDLNANTVKRLNIGLKYINSRSRIIAQLHNMNLKSEKQSCSTPSITGDLSSSTPVLQRSAVISEQICDLNAQPDTTSVQLSTPLSDSMSDTPNFSDPTSDTQDLSDETSDIPNPEIVEVADEDELINSQSDDQKSSLQTTVSRLDLPTTSIPASPPIIGGKPADLKDQKHQQQKNLPKGSRLHKNNRAGKKKTR